MIYPNSYDNRIWIAVSLEGTDIYQKGSIEYGISDDDGGLMIAFCQNKPDADAIVDRLNGKGNQLRSRVQ